MEEGKRKGGEWEVAPVGIPAINHVLDHLSLAPFLQRAYFSVLWAEFRYGHGMAVALMDLISRALVIVSQALEGYFPLSSRRGWHRQMDVSFHCPDTSDS